MQTRERRGDRATQVLGGGASGDPAGGHLNEMRQSADRFHEAGAGAIERALSQSSVGFMDAVRQEQGQ